MRTPDCHSALPHRLAAVAARRCCAGCGHEATAKRTATRSRIPRRSALYKANVKAGPEALRAFLEEFPKGADLHVHLSGAVYAETLIRDAGEDGLCVDTVALSVRQAAVHRES